MASNHTDFSTTITAPDASGASLKDTSAAKRGAIPTPKPAQKPAAAIPFAAVPFRPQTLTAFMQKQFPPKDELIEGVLYRRDRISLTGRRRNGKTTLLMNLALAGAFGRPEYLGLKIPRAFTTVAFYLEDDGEEVKKKLERMRQGQTTERFHLYTQEDFFDWQIKIGIREHGFKERIREACAAAHPDLVILDNLGHLIGGDYNNAKEIHTLMEFIFRLARDFNTAVLIAAHPRKGSRLNDGTTGAASLVQSPEMFFEECMGSSHFINSTGSLWGIERDYQSGRSNLLLGAQRVTGGQTLSVVEKNDNDWFERVDDLAIAHSLVVNTNQRRAAWEKIPAQREFTYNEAKEAVKPAMKSSGSFNPWWKELLRQKLVVETKPQRYHKVKLPGTRPETAAEQPCKNVATKKLAESVKGDSCGDKKERVN